MRDNWSIGRTWDSQRCTQKQKVVCFSKGEDQEGRSVTFLIWMRGPPWRHFRRLVVRNMVECLSRHHRTVRFLLCLHLACVSE